ncbi:MAG: diguanylate cyclase [Pelobacteraceae bacterium]|jgi:diguanylate cyclase (GGDEF)-like protein
MLPTRVTILSSDLQIASHVQLRLHSKGCQAVVMSCIDSVLGAFYADPPDLLIIDLSTDTACGTDIVSTLRSDSFFSTIPIIGILNTTDSDTLDWERCPLDDFIRLPLNFTELFSRISLARSRLKRIFDNNPLTRLPGNTSIQLAIEAAIGSATAVCYIDINYFKPYNDAYGFSHGDEVIRMTARIMFNAVRDAGGGFCGHIGGDDFVCIVPLDQAEAICQTIITHFDLIVLDLFDEETKRRGCYFGTNRKGDKENIPLLSVSIGIVPMNMPKLTHAAKVAEVAAELKKLAKDSGNSCYVVDNRSS